MSVSRETPVAGSFCVSRETKARLTVFTTLLQKWNERVNLVSAFDIDRINERHIGDSLRLLPLIPHDTPRAIDLGSGAGFPGLILAIVSGLHFDLIEADNRKAAFLAEAVRLTKAPATVYSARIESRPCQPAALITARALAPLTRLLELSAPLLASTGTCLFLKGQSVAGEIEEAAKSWRMNLVQHANSTVSDGVILQISQLARV